MRVSCRRRSPRYASRVAGSSVTSAKLQRVVARAGPAQQRAHAGAQLLDRERLHEVVVGAGVEPLDAVVDGVARRDDEDRHRVARGGAATGRPRARRSAASAGRARSRRRARRHAARAPRRRRRPRRRRSRPAARGRPPTRTAGSSSTTRTRVAHAGIVPDRLRERLKRTISARRPIRGYELARARHRVRDPEHVLFVARSRCSRCGGGAGGATRLPAGSRSRS